MGRWCGSAGRVRGSSGGENAGAPAVDGRAGVCGDGVGERGGDRGQFFTVSAGRGLVEAGFNPAEGGAEAAGGAVRGTGAAEPGGVGEAVLRAMRRDRSALGKRDLAFTLARLRMGVALERLRTVRGGR